VVIVARKIAAAPALDLYDPGTEFGKLARAQWCRYRVFQGNDRDSGKRGR
jgi:hypothetical protein